MGSANCVDDDNDGGLLNLGFAINACSYCFFIASAGVCSLKYLSISNKTSGNFTVLLNSPYRFSKNVLNPVNWEFNKYTKKKIEKG